MAKPPSGPPCPCGYRMKNNGNTWRCSRCGAKLPRPEGFALHRERQRQYSETHARRYKNILPEERKPKPLISRNPISRINTGVHQTPLKVLSAPFDAPIMEGRYYDPHVFVEMWKIEPAAFAGVSVLTCGIKFTISSSGEIQEAA